MKKAICLLLSLLLMVCSFAGCGGGSTASTFTVALGSDIVSLDPAFAYDFTTNPVVNQITEGLLTFDQDNQLQPCLAKSWEQKDDVTYVYQIRDDVTFSDGTPMTMDDVMFSIERTMNPDTASYVQWMFSAVKAVEQTGDWELTVTLNAPSVTWKYMFGTTAGHIISKDYYEAHKDNFGTPEGGILGTGAYQYDSWKRGQEVVLVKNENYWNTETPATMEKLVFKIISEDTTRVTALQSGQVDFTIEVPTDMIDTLRSSENITLESVDTMGITYLAFNTQRAPFDDVNLRRAISCAIDRESLQKNITKDAGTIGTALPNSSVLFTSEPERWEEYAQSHPGYTYDLEKAKEYMAASSVPEGFDCTMLLTEASTANSYALAIQEALKELNINVELVKLSSDEHTTYQFGGVMDENGVRDYDMILAGWEADYPDICGNIEPLYSGANAGEGGSNAAAYANSQVDELITQQSACSDAAERNDLVFEAMDLIIEDTPYVSIAFPVRLTALNKDFTGFTMNASWIWNLYFKNIKPVA
mgnify:CR=1 FL=1